MLLFKSLDKQQIVVGRFVLPILLLSAIFTGCTNINSGTGVTAGKTWKYDFGNGKTEAGYKQITDTSIYTEAKGFGIIAAGEIEGVEDKSGNSLNGDWLISKEPYYFKLHIPEGRYKITLSFGNDLEATSTTIKAESRRLMLENVNTKKGETVTKTIIVDQRTARINDTLSICLKSREYGYLNWDSCLNVEITGEKPCVTSMEIEEANDLPVIFLAGNSTVTDQDYEPWASWGQMITNFLKPEVVVANYAESGETLLSFKGARRLQKIISVMKPGDYLLMEFAHNDQKPGSCHVEPYTTYLEQLRYFTSEAKKKGGKPVLVTSTNRRKFDEDGFIVNTLEEYPDAMRQLSQTDSIPLIDLNAMSKLFYEALGEDGSKKAFVHYPANTFPGQEKPLADNTHFNAYGAYELAKCVVQQILDNKIDLSKYIVDDWTTFNPSQPDDPDTFYWPLSPAVGIRKPDGN